MNIDAPRRRTNRLMIALLLIAIAVTVASAINQVVFASAQQDRNLCYQEAFDRFVVAVARLDQGATAERRAQRDLLIALGGNETEEERRAAYADFFAVLERADQVRAGTTLLPLKGCG